ncbi:D-alanyl-D-alanine carboxypeptidase family protein [Erythrobacter sp. HL-111]|uniref:D-alanyl-D-alanine carboxypeptidase family protein n=1 Tax=Erythrobacter sp. HL-111 TaxID=1798193 RepID=UPI001F2C8E5C|nr:D-alanyl-D-alanine carboxypeptidase family protein [Erythrobacter sp. HL-111]
MALAALAFVHAPAPAGPAGEGRSAAPAIPPGDEVPIALLVDVSSGQILHQRNARRRFVPASMTKTMSAYVAFELIEQGRLDPGQVMTIRPETWRAWSGKGSTMWLPADARVTVNDLLMGLMTVSANDAAIVLAEGAAGSVENWAALMNVHARELGMTDSHFANPNGWMDEGRTFTSARDLALLAEAMIRRHPEKFRRYIGNENFTYNDVTQGNHDPLIGRVRGAEGIKTGFTNEAGFGFLGTVRRGAQRLVLVTAGVDRGDARDGWARRYVEWGFSAFERRRLFDAGEEVAQARVQGGSARRVTLVADRPVEVSVPRGRAGEMTLSVRYDGPLRAPVAAGSRVATLRIEVPGMDEARIPLFAGEPVGIAGPLDRIVNAFARWLG